jgi:phosphoribosylformylglycinamidine cyclo-ligase
VLSGSAMGIIKSKDELIKCNIQAGDEIIILESSGIHANGLTLARKIAEKLPDGYLTKLSDGRSFGESLLDPTLIYVPFIRRLLEKKVDIHYAVNITGHGWRKLMRANESFAYVIEFTPRVHPVFEFIQKHGPVSTEEAYGNFNMGAGFAVIVPSSERTKVLTTARIAGFFPVMAGHVEQSTEKKVIIKEHELEYKASSLQVR